MCMFSESVEVVHDTKIFARMDGADQYLAYAMSLTALSELAMILPLPTVPHPGDDAVTFVDLSECPFFFERLADYFHVEMLTMFDDDAASASLDLEQPPLVVHDVGSFDASFVPNVASFARLDERFRLSDSLWSQLPQYEDYGFAVFKLKAGGNKLIHPMAMRFPTRDTSTLFFPTLHIHDGTIPERASFDHALYCQGPHRERAQWEESGGPIADDASPDFVGAPEIMLTPEKTKGVIAFGEPAWKLAVTGLRANQDVLLHLA